MGVISFLVGIVILIVILKLFLLPFKLIIKFVINSIVGGILLFVLGMVGIAITMTWWVILLVGLLGIPGVVIALILKIFI